MAPDLVERDVTAHAPDRLGGAAITDVPPWTGFLYLAVVIEVFSRRGVGWAMATDRRPEVVLQALERALWQRRPEGGIHHSEQGCQYTWLAFGWRCREAGVRPSMGAVGDGYDHARCERFFAPRECELLDRRSLRTPDEARLAGFEFSEGGYHPHRRHSALDYRSPNDSERRYATLTCERKP